MVNFLTFLKLGTYVFPMYVIYQIRQAQLAAQPMEEEGGHEEHDKGKDEAKKGHH
eukprot:CAMPEP_0176463664 /NCGR_PEP_ID=MMETSP0127-20121128/36033_1 /TAXON_ID=938130 /ORGANISM="Platyophrya macrostoma, Strain WH" /LENGTH=54 /DNA_ID=CAMNT_0017855887 /DNA_START=46 /DNA_END=210 /DNA_ORIENTATION=-